MDDIRSGPTFWGPYAILYTMFDKVEKRNEESEMREKYSEIDRDVGCSKKKEKRRKRKYEGKSERKGKYEGKIL